MINRIRAKYFYIILGLVGVILLLAAFLPITVIQQGGIKSVFTEAAIAIFITIMLSLTLERYASAEFREEVDRAIEKTRKAVLDATYESLVPKEIYEEMRSLILTRPFIRRNVECYISLRWLSQRKDFFELQTRFSYLSENITNLPQSYTVFAEIERSINPELRDKIGFEHLIVGGKKYEGKSLQAITRKDQRRFFLSEQVEIFPGKPILISIQDVRVESAVGEFTILMGYPTINLVVTVSHPKGLIVEPVIRHPDPNRLIKVDGTDTLSIWRFDGGILPYLGVKVNWYPIEKTIKTSISKKRNNPVIR